LQKFLNEVEESDAGKKKLIDQSCGFVDGLKAASAIESSHHHHHHDSVSDQSFLNNILGGCERDKKKKKGSNSNGGSRRSKFQHSLKITSGPQSSVYNGNVGNISGSNNNNNNNSNVNSNSCGGGGGSSSSTSSVDVNANSPSFHSSSRGSSSRAHQQQSLSSRLSASSATKPATFHTSSSNIDVPMVTTYNKQPIMTPAVVPRKQQKAELVLLDGRRNTGSSGGSGDESCGGGGSVKNVADVGAAEEIELKSLNEMGGGCNYTARASLEIDGSVSKLQQVDADEQQQEDENRYKYNSSTEDGLISCSAKVSELIMIDKE
jgi:hypothetical protein